MEVIRRNTDYGLRMMVNLAKHSGNGELMSASQLVHDGNISYEVGRKLLQRLRDAKLVKSVMGSNGGFKLNRKPSKISLREIINVLQGEVYLNECLIHGRRCEFESKCEVNTKLAPLQQLLADYLDNVTLEEILQSRSKKSKKAEKRFSKKKN
jgi:Rrf2 family protein